MRVRETEVISMSSFNTTGQAEGKLMRPLREKGAIKAELQVPYITGSQKMQFSPKW